MITHPAVLVEWTDRLALGVDEIDRQHYELVAILNDLHAAMSDGRDHESVAWSIGALTAYTKFHFGFEEKLLARHGYADLHAHTLEHRMFVRTLSDFKVAYAEGTAGLSLSLMAFLGDWLEHHIMGTDRRWVPAVAMQDVRDLTGESVVDITSGTSGLSASPTVM